MPVHEPTPPLKPPPMTATPPREHRVQLYLHAETKQDLREWAHGTGKALSQLVRELLEAAVVKRRKAHGFD